MSASPPRCKRLMTSQSSIRTAVLPMRVRENLDAALTEIDRAKGALFDSRFAAISDEIETWWELLRPEAEAA